METSDDLLIRSHLSVPIVGVGASAGGLDAVTQLLRNLPPQSGMAFVLIQHLDPNHQSILVELLSKVTEMPVHQAEENMKVEANQVYVIPPGKEMRVKDGLLTLTSREENRGLHMPIDIFFRSLAEEQDESAIAIILSGNGSDGSLGAEEINKKGGVTLVQEPQSAQFDSMPRNAIATERINFVLPPDLIAKKLVAMSHPPFLKAFFGNLGDADIAVEEDAYRQILELVRGRTNIDFSQYKQNTIHRRILRRMLVSGSESLTAYLAHLKKNPDEVGELFNDILIKVTRFFRDPKEFELLKTRIFPEIIKGRSQENPIRIWVPGCSTGEEVYSIAIYLREFLEENGRGDAIQIFGTDVSERALEKARVGSYPDNIEADVSDERLRRFFGKLSGRYQINKSIRDLCVFASQNVVRDPPFSRLDLISCRNLLIYLNADLQKKTLSLFHYSLKAKGWLMLGGAESVAAIPGRFSTIDKAHRLFMKQGLSSLDRSSLALPDKAPESPLKSRAPLQVGTSLVNMQKEVDRVLIRRYAPIGVIVNDQLEILQFRGDTAAYIVNPQGEASLNILRMAREGLRTEIDEALRHVKKKRQSFRKNGIRFRADGKFREVNIEVIPIKAPLSGETWWAIMFDEAKISSPKKLKAAKHKKGKAHDLTSKKWLEELESTKAYLESIIHEKETIYQEAQSAHEEVLSSNEEFQSINEELQTAKEELQSTNEELLTLNNELQSANRHSLELVNDLNNLFDSEEIPIIMVSKDLRIRRYTPLAEKALNLIPTDVGRLISDLKPRINIADLENLISNVVTTGALEDRYVQDENGRWYSLRIRPYRTIDKTIEGAMVLLIDVDSLKRSELGAEAARKEIGKMNDQLERRVVKRTSELTTANTDLEAFCYSVSHDLSTPLRGINGYARLLQKEFGEKLDERGSEYLKNVRDATSRMALIIDDLLNLSRLGRKEMRHEDVNLSDVATTIAANLKTSEPDRQVEFSIMPSLIARGDGSLIRIALSNLIGNSWKFTSKKSSAKIEFGRAEISGEIVYFVRDNGVGFDMTFSKRMFDAFQRLHKDDEFKGSGIGLATVHRVIARHGGRIWAEGLVDNGATIYFTLSPGGTT